MATVNTSSVKVAIVILTVNQRDKTVRCLSSLRSVKSPKSHIVLWDNGSRDGTAEAVQEAFPEVLVHYHPSNLGVASGRNAAADLAVRTLNPSHLLFLDNDTIVTPGFLDGLLEPFQGDSRLAQTVPKIMLLDDPQRLYAAGGRVQFWTACTRPIGYGEIDRGQYDQPAKCTAPGCTLVRTDVFQEVGRFDPRFDPYGHEDLDFSLRTYKAGYYALYVPRSVVLHESSSNCDGSMYSESHVRNKTRNWFQFMRKHASLAEQIGFILLGSPYRVVCAVIREGRKGNLTALRGMFGGVLDFWKKAKLEEKSATPGSGKQRNHSPETQ